LLIVLLSCSQQTIMERSTKSETTDCKNSKSLRVNQVKIQFTNKPITAWGGLATIVAKLLGVLEFRSWVQSTIPIEEKSNNVKGVYEKMLATFLTVLSGGECFSHLDGLGNPRSIS